MVICSPLQFIPQLCSYVAGTTIYRGDREGKGEESPGSLEYPVRLPHYSDSYHQDLTK